MENKPCDSCAKNGKPNCGNAWCYTNKEKSKVKEIFRDELYDIINNTTKEKK